MGSVLCECGAPSRGPVCQRGHRLRESWQEWDKKRVPGGARHEAAISAASDELNAAHRDGNDARVRRAKERLESLGCDVEMTAGGWMVSR